jgi:hypothetical protein
MNFDLAFIVITLPQMTLALMEATGGAPGTPAQNDEMNS